MEAFRHQNAPHANNQFSMEPPASYDQVKQEQRKARAKPSLARIVVRVVSLAVGASVLAVLAAAVAVWYSTRHKVLQQSRKLPQAGWPDTMEMKPTYLLLAAAGIAVIVQLVSLFTLVGPIRRLRESNLHVVSVFVTSLIGIALWIGAAVYFKIQEQRGAPWWTLWSWSCQHEDWTNGEMSFSSMCTRMQYSFYAAIVVGVLELASLALFAHRMRNVKNAGGGYSKITPQQIG